MEQATYTNLTILETDGITVRYGINVISIDLSCSFSFELKLFLATEII
jgi:hypothetical protein